MKQNTKPTKRGTSAPLAIVEDHGRIGLLCLDSVLLSKGLHIYWSPDGFHFSVERHPIILQKGSKMEKIELCRDFSFSKEGTRSYLTYVREDGKGAHFVTAVSTNMHNFEVVNEIPKLKHKSVVVRNFAHEKSLLMYVGGLFITTAYLKNNKEWKIDDELLFTSRSGDFDRSPIRLMGAFTTARGIMRKLRQQD